MARDVILREVVVSMAQPWPAVHPWRAGGEWTSLKRALQRTELLNGGDNQDMLRL